MCRCFTCVCAVAVCDCLIVRECRSPRWVLQSAAFTPFPPKKNKRETCRSRSRARLQELWRRLIYVCLCKALPNVERSPTVCSMFCFMTERERVKIHPAPGRRSLWQPLLWWRQGCTWRDGGHGTLGDSPSGAARGGTHTYTHTHSKHKHTKTSMNSRRKIKVKETIWGETQGERWHGANCSWAAVPSLLTGILYFYSITFL